MRSIPVFAGCRVRVVLLFGGRSPRLRGVGAFVPLAFRASGSIPARAGYREVVLLDHSSGLIPVCAGKPSLARLARLLRERSIPCVQ